MQLSFNQTTAYQFIAHFVALMLVYAAATLLGAVKFLGADPLAASLPYSQVAQFADAVLLLALISGVIGGGLISSDLVNISFPDERLLRYTRRAWTLLCLLTVGAGILGLLAGRAGLALPPFLALAFALLIALVLFVVVRVLPRWSGTAFVWAVGMTAILIGTVIGLLPADAAHSPLLGVIAVALRDHLGIGLGVIALIFWQMGRFSTLATDRIERGLYRTAGLWSLGVMLLTLQPLYALGVTTPMIAGVVGLPLIMAIFAAHVFPAFGAGSQARSQSPLWVGLALSLLFTGVGIVGAINALPDVNLMIAGTRLTDLARTLVLLAFAAALFGMVTAEIRPEGRHTLGAAAFWLIGVGALGITLGLGAAGIVQVYLERLLSVGYLETQTLIIPLYTLWVIGWLAAALGLVGFALDFWTRRASPLEST